MKSRCELGSLAVVATLATCCAASGSIPATVVHVGERIEPFAIAGLDECDDARSSELEIDPDRPLVLVVHGCNASGGRFRTLARVFEAHGQQTVCFNYDDRESMERTAVHLRAALVALERYLRRQPITVLGHSQGGLVARRALARGALEEEPAARYRLVTVSSPFNGIEASSHCALAGLHVITLGVSALLCRAIAGDKWNDIHPDAEFMREPGELVAAVEAHLRIATDERDSCRRFDTAGGCLEDDYVFSLEEQANRAIEDDPRVVVREIKAGHAEVVGDAGRSPDKLIGVLAREGVLAETPDERRPAITAALRVWYR